MLKVDVNKLKTVKHTEGLVLQGCGGELQEWAEGINELLKKKDILIDDLEFHEVLVFEHEGLTNLLFTFGGMCTDVRGLAMQRIRARTQLGSIWLSGYVKNQLGDFLDSAQRPGCPLILANGNIFDLMAVVPQTLKRQGQDGLAK